MTDPVRCNKIGMSNREDRKAVRRRGGARTAESVTSVMPYSSHFQALHAVVLSLSLLG
jgi:hypothetical protein